jgi:predicted O-methyltransferase YrrM
MTLNLALHLRRAAARWLAPSVSSAPLASPAADPAYAVCDVTTYADAIDLAALEVIRWAPVWMTRAERLALFALAFGLRPQRYLEIGTFRGGSALVVEAAMSAAGNAAGRLICVDPAPQIAPEHWQRLMSRTTLLTARSPECLPAALATAGGPFDLALIDGDHSYAGVLADAEGALPLLADGAYMLFHDNFYPEIGAALRDFAARHAGRVLDAGPLTREVTAHQADGVTVHWGGLRLMHVRTA